VISLRNALIPPPHSDIRPIGDKVQRLYGRIVTEGYVEEQGDLAAISGLAEDLRDVLIEHWVSLNSESLVQTFDR
jgi:hypothetical protein